MGRIIDKATVQHVDHDGNPAVKCLRLDGGILNADERVLIWKEILDDGWKCMDGSGKEFFLYRTVQAQAS